jgi:hypothetical protein
MAVIATNSPIEPKLAIHSKQTPYRTYVIGAEIPKKRIPDALYGDTLDPYHYVRLQPGKGHDILIAGGEDHRTGEADDATRRFSKLEKWIDPWGGRGPPAGRSDARTPLTMGRSVQARAQNNQRDRSIFVRQHGGREEHGRLSDARPNLGR